MICHSLQIILQANWTDSSDGSMALDDIHIIRGRYCDDPVPTTTTAPATTTSSSTAAPASDMDCTFEQGDI